MMKSHDSRTSGDGDVGAPDAKRASDAVKYIQHAFSLIDKIDDSATAGVAELKVFK